MPHAFGTLWHPLVPFGTLWHPCAPLATFPCGAIFDLIIEEPLQPFVAGSTELQNGIPKRYYE